MAYDTTLRTYGTFSSGYGSMMGHVARTARAEKATAPRKTLYWGAGSGIGEVRVILSGVVIHGYLYVLSHLCPNRRAPSVDTFQRVLGATDQSVGAGTFGGLRSQCRQRRPVRSHGFLRG